MKTLSEICLYIILAIIGASVLYLSEIAGSNINVVMPVYALCLAIFTGSRIVKINIDDK